MAEFVDGMKITKKLRRMLKIMIEDPPELTGYRLTVLAEMGPGTIYPELARLERHEWATSWWETPEPEDRPRRRFYRLTPFGRTRVNKLLGIYDTPGDSGL